MEIIIRKDYYEPLEITIPDLIKEFEKKRNNPRGYPFMDTFRSWILYCEDNGEDVSAFEEDLPELEKAQTLAIIEEKIGWAEENPAEAHICLMSEIKELMKRTEVPEKTTRKAHLTTRPPGYCRPGGQIPRRRKSFHPFGADRMAGRSH